MQRRFLSCEPLLGPVELRPEWAELELQAFGGNGLQCFPRVDWLIVGGESGPDARPMDLAWARSLVEQCRAYEVAVFIKQLGRAWSQAASLGAGHGGDPAHWPADLRVRELP